MKARKTVQERPATRQVGLRLKAQLADEIQQLAEADERNLTWVITKIIEIGLPIFKERQIAS